MFLTSSCRSLALPPGKPVKLNVIQDIRITSAALGEVIADPHSRSAVKLQYLDMAPTDYDDSELQEGEQPAMEMSTILCALTPGKVRLYFVSPVTSLQN